MKTVSLIDSLNSIRKLTDQIGRKIKIMEVCGTHTVCAFRSGLRSLLPKNLELISGPGCPVCVTDVSFIDFLMEIARSPETIIATFGDMLRVPGSTGSLEYMRAQGAKIEVLYSPMEGVSMAENNPQNKIVLPGIGFETTAPAVAWSIMEAYRRKLANYFVLSAHKTMPEAMMALLSNGDVKIDAFLCPGHVSAIIGILPYKPIAEKFHTPCVITGFEPIDMIGGIEASLKQIASSQSKVENAYRRAVAEEGNTKAKEIMNEVFESTSAFWRGLGEIEGSGLKIRQKYQKFDAAKKFISLKPPQKKEPALCRCGDILRGAATPEHCKLFRKSCTPDTPVGACMVSSEGTCSTYFHYQK
jgi:hydrogenase expression/formation protein HypD